MHEKLNLDDRLSVGRIVTQCILQPFNPDPIPHTLSKLSYKSALPKIMILSSEMSIHDPFACVYNPAGLPHSKA